MTRWAETEPITEYGQLMAGGGYSLFLDRPDIEQIYPLADRVKAGMRHGGVVGRRRVIVVEDWQEVKPGDPVG